MCFEKQTKAFGRNKGVLRFFVSLDMEIRMHTTSGQLLFFDKKLLANPTDVFLKSAKNEKNWTNFRKR